MRRSASVLRAHNRHREAHRADRYAMRVRLTLDDPTAMRRMRVLAASLYDAPDAASVYERAVEGAVALTAADHGNVQVSNGFDGALRIWAHSGFNSEFLEYFAVVRNDGTACGRAASDGLQTTIADVNADAAFRPHRHIAAASRFRAVQSTPLIDPVGELRGVVSTHFRSVHRPSDRDLAIVQWYGEHVAAVRRVASDQLMTRSVASARTSARPRSP